MKPKSPKIVVFADLDGTILNESYDYSEVEPTIRQLLSLNVSIVLCSSKTKAEIEFYRRKLGISSPFIVRTGSAEHNMWLAAYAISKGMRIRYSEGLIKEGTVIAGETEKEVFEALGLPYPLPNEREIADGKPVWMPTPETK